MLKLFKVVVHDCCTGIDGVSYNPVRIIGYSSCALAMLVYFCNSVWMAFTKDVFDYIGFGTGFAAIMGGLLAVGAAEAVKVHTEPPAEGAK